jgi:phage host-nuclease inhibitor protein Gam
MVGRSGKHELANWQWQTTFTHTNTAGWLNDHLQHPERKLHLCRVLQRTWLMRYLQLQKYLNLPQKDKVIAEYVWIDGSNGIRSKSKVSSFQVHPSSTALSALRHL